MMKMILKKYNLLIKYFQLRKKDDTSEETKDDSFDTPYTSDDEDDIKNMKEIKDDTSKETKDDTSKETKDDKLDKTKDELDKSKDELDKTKDKLDKTKDDTSKKSYASHGFDINGKHKDTDDIYDLNGFDINSKHINNNNNKYDTNGLI